MFFTFFNVFLFERFLHLCFKQLKIEDDDYANYDDEIMCSTPNPSSNSARRKRSPAKPQSTPLVIVKLLY